MRSLPVVLTAVTVLICAIADAPSRAQGFRLTDGATAETVTGSIGNATRSNPARDWIPLTESQRARLRVQVGRTRPPRLDDPEFAPEVGGPVPVGVRPAEVPWALYRHHPGLRGLLYFLAGDEIVVVEPGSMTILARIAV